MSATNKDIANFYDGYVVSQKKKGVNSRHRTIIQNLKAFGLKNNATVLEIGCGIGTLTGLLSDHVSKGKVVAVDISPKSIEQAKEILKSKRNIEFLVSDMTDFHYAGTFDCVVLPDVLEHIPVEQHQALFFTLAKYVGENSFIAINIPDPYYLEWARVHRPELLQIVDQSIYTNELLEKVYKAGLHLFHLESYSLSMEEPDYQWIILKPYKKAGQYHQKSSLARMMKSIKLRLTSLI